MRKCFLLIETLDTDGCFSVCLDENGVYAPLQKRTAQSLKPLQADAETIVVVPTSHAGIHLLELPWLGERKSREAIPFALEENLAEPCSALHFAFQKSHYQNGRYCIIVVHKQAMLAWMDALQTHGFEYDCITLDWFALHIGEAFVSANSLVVYHENYKGALGHELAKSYCSELHPADSFRFTDSSPDIQSSQLTAMTGITYEFIATRLFHAQVINLCQGEFAHHTSQKVNQYWLKMAAALGGVWLLCVVGMLALNWTHVHRELLVTKAKIATVYRAIFPDESQVVNAKERIEQLLKGNASSQQRPFWALLNALSAAANQMPTVEMTHLDYKSNRWAVTLNTPDFATLESFENHLKKTSVHVTQVSASSQDKHVTAVLELTE